MIKYLYTPTVKRTGTPTLCTKQELSTKQGFRSVFGYPEETVRQIHRQGNTRDITHLPVLCDELLVDFDDNPEAAYFFQEFLMDGGYGFVSYDSGNRSMHYHIPIIPIEGHWVPNALYRYASKHIKGCDLSVYRHTGLFRLPGTWHEKNPGHMKRLCLFNEGMLLEIPPVTVLPISVAGDKGAPLEQIINKVVDTGGRRCYAYTIGSVCNKRGLSVEQALRIALQWNDLKARPPLEADVLMQKIWEAYD